MLYLFDLDGTLITSYMDNPDKDYHKWSLLPGRAVRLDVLAANGHEIGIVSNQGGVAFGLISEEDVRRKFASVADQFGFGSVAINSQDFAVADLLAFVCYGDRRSRNPRYQDDSRRKPSGTMIIEAAAALNYGLASVVYVGDRPEDRAAAQSAGVAFQWAHEFFG